MIGVDRRRPLHTSPRSLFYVSCCGADLHACHANRSVVQTEVTGSNHCARSYRVRKASANGGVSHGSLQQRGEGKGRRVATLPAAFCLFPSVFVPGIWSNCDDAGRGGRSEQLCTLGGHISKNARKKLEVLKLTRNK